MRVNGVVLRIEDGYAWVDVSVAQGCGRCQEPGGCGGVNIAKPFGSSSRAVRVRNEINARPGEQVGVVVEEGVPLQGLTNGLAQALGTPVADVQTRVQQLMDERRQMEKEIGDLRRKLAMSGGSSGAAAPAVQDVGGIKFDARVVDLPAKDLKPMADELKKLIGSGVVALISTAEGKASIMVGVTSDLACKLDAVALVKTAAEVCGGKGGGGRPDMAQAGGPDGDKAKDALTALASAIQAA